jgi:outer membrane protein OmpA-like peptidoglycan-associated protein
VNRQAAITLPADADFYPYRCQAANAGDVSGDPVTGNRERDMVGDATFPAFYRAADATHVFFRMRIDANPLKNNGVDLQPSSWDVLVDTDNNLQTYEFMLTADGNMAGTKVHWVRNSVQQVGNPRDPAGDNMPADLLANFSPATDYYKVRLTGDGSNFSGDPDYFVTLVIPKANLQAAGLNLNNSFVAWGGTNAQNYSLNADFGCFVGIPGNLADAAPEPGPLDPAGTPDAIADSAVTNEDTAVTTTVLANDVGLRDTPISLTITTQPTNGSVVVNPNNTVTYTPAANFHGTDSYTYRIADSEGQSDTAVVTVTVTPVNDAPTGAGDTFSVAANSSGTTLDVLANDSSAPDANEQLSVTAVTQPSSGGTVSVAPNGAGVVFTPANGFTGPVTFTYTVSDGNGGSSTVTVTVNVQAGNNPPNAVADTATVAEDSGATVVDVLANDTFAPDTNEQLTVTAVTQPASGGSVTLQDGLVRFTPSPNYNGTVTFSYTVSDGNGGTDTATVTMTVTAVNDPPTAAADAVTVTEDSGATVVDVLANDTFAPDTNEQLSVMAVTQPASGGSVTLVDGVVHFTPAPNYNGPVTFTYTVSDGNGGTNTATVTVNVTAENDAPEAVDDTLTVAEDSATTVVNVLANDTFAPDSNEQLTVTAVTQPANGTVTLVGGVVSYVPNANFHGTDTFTYTVSDGNGGTDTATVTMTVTAVNDPPTGAVDTFSVARNSGATTLDVLANDSFAPDANEQLTVSAVTQPSSGGTVSVAPNGAGVVFTPANGYSGPVTFTYTVSDGNGGSTEVTVTVNVQNNNPPDAVADEFPVAEDSGATVLDVLANDSFAPDANEQLTVTAVTQPASGGSVTLQGGLVSFTPSPNYNGPVTFTYTVSDGNGGTDTATVTVNVTAVNDPPTAAADTVTVTEDGGATVVDVLANDTFAPDANEQLTVTAVTQPASGGSVTLQGGVVSFTPAPNYNGPVTFSYTVSDGNGGTNTATVTVNVTAENDAPDAVADAFPVAEDSGPTVVDVLANDSFAPDANEQLTVTAVTQPATGGTVTLVNGEVSFTPAPDYNGPVTFTYTVSDGNGGTDTATVTINVTAVNDAPTGVADTFSTVAEGGPTTLDVLANDSSAPDANEQLTVTAVTQPANGGTVSVAPNGAGVVFTPAPGYSGPVTFTYTVSDGNGGSTEVSVTVNVQEGNHPPDAVADAVTVEEDSGATVVDVLANDSTAPDANEQLTVTAVTQPASGGTVTLQGGVVSFTPAPNYNGTVTFSYTVSDGNGGTDTATITVTVTAVNDAPTGVADSFPVGVNNGPTTLDVLANDSAAPDANETLTVTAVTQPATGGTVSVAPNGAGVVFTPAPGYSGPVTFTYTVSDGNGGSTEVTVTVDVGFVDSDDDGIPDHIEREIGLSPNDSDNDDDGVPDGDDGLADTDGDGVIDALDGDSDNDGLTDGTERGVTAETAPSGTDTSSPNFQPDSEPSTTTDPHNADTDGDGLKDGTEDGDHDGRLDDTESDPNDADTDDGGASDSEEALSGGNPRNYADDLAVAGRGCASTGSGLMVPLALLLALPLLRRRQAPRGAVGAWGLLGLLLAVFAAAPASAQSATPSQGIDVQQYKPGPGLRDVLGLHSAQVGRHLDWNAGLSFNYAKDPLNFLNPRTDTFVYELVKNQFTFDLMGSIALFDWLEVGVALPITSQGSGSNASVAPLFPDGVDATGIGDLRLVPKVHLPALDGRLHLGIAVPVLLPTSGGRGFLGRSGVAASPRVLGEWTSQEGLRVLANVGFNFQPEAQLYNLNVGNEFAYGVGTEVPFQVGQHRLAGEATLVGSVGLGQSNAEERPLELLGAVKYHFSDALSAHVGGGPGLTRGYGTPGFRLFAGLLWTEAMRAVPARIEPPPPPPAPVCPQGPEDLDGFQDGDGCADPDNDGDGLLDGNDRCPGQPETKNGFQDEDGCPDELPPPPPVDTDGDGLTDDQDRCPGAAEDKDGFEDADGCPEVDNDRDSVVDTADKCPAEPETINGVADEDGCPDKGKVKVLVQGDKILILEKVYFATNKDVILPRSFSLLTQVAAVLRANPQITKVRVEGHTDSQGNDASNLDLSQRRANTVRQRLVQEEGIAAERLEAVGYGESRPVDSNKTAKGRENNRRVEFIILEMEK